MITLEQLAEDEANWPLSEFVDLANDLLPQYLPVEKGNTKVREHVTARLVRHYTTLGMLDEPLKTGRESRYVYRHLLQLLVVRRLLAEGYGASAIDDLAKTSDNDRLKALLLGGAQLQVSVANPALAFLNEIQQRPSVPKPKPRAIKTQITRPQPKAPKSPTQWTRVEILPGLELHVRDDFQYPASHQEQQTLLTRLIKMLESFSRKRR